MSWDASFDMERCIFLYNPCLGGKMSWDAYFDMERYIFLYNPCLGGKMGWDAYFDMERYIFLYNPCLGGKMSWDASFDMESYPPMVDEVSFNSTKRGKVRRNPIVSSRILCHDLMRDRPLDPVLR